MASSQILRGRGPSPFTNRRPSRRIVQQTCPGRFEIDVLHTSQQYSLSSANPPQGSRDLYPRHHTGEWPSRCLQRCAADCEAGTVPPMLISSTRTSHSALWQHIMQEMHTRTTSPAKYLLSCHTESITGVQMSVWGLWDRACDGGL